MRTRWGIVLALLLATACGAPSGPTADNIRTDATPSETSEPPHKAARSKFATYDDVLARLGKRFPGFAGVEVDERRGRLLIYASRKLGDVEGLHTALTRAFGVTVGGLEPEVVMRRYSFRQLKRWYDPFSMRVFSFEGVTTSDINESTNTIDIGVTDVDRYAAAIHALARRQDIPSGVVRVIHQEPFGFD